MGFILVVRYFIRGGYYVVTLTLFVYITRTKYLGCVKCIIFVMNKFSLCRITATLNKF